MIQEVVDEIKNLSKAVINEIHTVLTCQVISFDTETMTATVKPYGRIKLTNGKLVDFPIISHVPVVTLTRQPEDIGIAMPVKAGDEGLLLMSEIALTAWRNKVEDEGNLKFDLSNAIFLPGIVRTSELLKAATEQDAIIIKTKNAQIAVSDSIKVTGCDLYVDGNIFYTGTIQKA